MGELLQASPGRWRDTPTSGLSYQWRRCGPTGAKCRSIRTATQSSYRLTRSDLGRTLRVVVTAASGSHRTRAVSTRTAVVQSDRDFANVWISPTGGSCQRSATAARFAPARACATPAAAYAVANATADATKILVKGGTYPPFLIDGARSSPNRIIFEAAPGERPVFAGGYLQIGVGEVTWRGPDYVTVRNLETAEFGPGFANPSNRYGIYVAPGSSHIRLENMRAGNFLIQAAQDIAVIGGDFGPCRAADGGQPCEINKVDHYPGAPQPSRILIDGATFHDYDLGPSCFGVGDGGTSSGTPDCHWRAMYLNGVHNFTLRNSVFRDSFIAPWFTISGPEASASGNKNILIENNIFGTGVNYGNPGRYNGRQYARWESIDLAWCQNVSNGVFAYDNVTYRFNSGSRSAGLAVLFSESGCQGKIRNVRAYGNIGLRNRCDPLVEYRYNVYSNSGRCHSTDVALGRGSFPFYVKDTDAPHPGDFRLRGRRAAPDNRVPARLGCPRTDRTGKPRPRKGFCDAGAFER